MNKRDVLEVALKIIGIYYLFAVIGESLSIFFFIVSASHNQNKFVYPLVSSVFFSLVLTVVFLWKGKRIAELLTQDSSHAEVQSALTPHAHLYFWVKILGLYFFCISCGSSRVRHSEIRQYRSRRNCMEQTGC